MEEPPPARGRGGVVDDGNEEALNGARGGRIVGDDADAVAVCEGVEDTEFCAGVVGVFDGNPGVGQCVEHEGLSLFFVGGESLVDGLARDARCCR